MTTAAHPAHPLRRRTPRRRSRPGAALAVLALVAAAVLAPVVAVPGAGVAPASSGAVAAAAGRVVCDASLLSPAALVDCLQRTSGGSRPPTTGGGAGSGGSGGATGPVYRYRYVITCVGNTVDAPRAVLCDQATATCPAGLFLYWQYRSLDGAAWDLVGSRCMTPAEAAQGEAFPGFTAADFRLLPLPPGDVVLQPGNGFALAQVPLGVMAVAGVAVLPTQLLGFDVAVRATPVSYTWDFGDGTTTGPTSDPGAPYPALDVAHSYTAAGGYAVTLTTTYAGEFSVDGGAFTPIDGLAAVVSAPVPVTVLAAHGALVQDPLGG